MESCLRGCRHAEDFSFVTTSHPACAVQASKRLFSQWGSYGDLEGGLRSTLSSLGASYPKCRGSSSVYSMY